MYVGDSVNRAPKLKCVVKKKQTNKKHQKCLNKVAIIGSAGCDGTLLCPVPLQMKERSNRAYGSADMSAFPGMCALEVSDSLGHLRLS